MSEPEQQAVATQPEETEIDWNNFVVVETIDFEGENENQQAAALVQQPAAGSSQTNARPVVPNTPSSEQPAIKIRLNYKPQSKKQEQPLIKCRVCGNMIAADYINQHLQIELLDPKYVELKEEYEARGLGKNLAQGRDVAGNLEKLAIRRPDIFGDSEVYHQMLKRETEQLALQQSRAQIWDGQMKGMSRTSANIAMMQNQQRKQQQPSSGGQMQGQQNYGGGQQYS